MGDMKKLVGLSVALTMIITGSIAVATNAEAGETETKIIKSKASGTFVSTNFDFDHPDLSTPSSYSNAAGNSDAGKFTFQAVLEFASKGTPCTVPGRPANAGLEFKLAGEDGVSRFTESGDLLFFKGTTSKLCEDFSTFPTPPFAFIDTETGVVTGGTGKYSGVTGTYTAEAKGATLSVDPTGTRIFGWFENEVVQTLTLKEE
jgi:hypothetical protein